MISSPVPLNQWLSSDLWNAFQIGKTSAHRLCSARDGWVERLGDNLLISFQNQAIRDRLFRELDEWCARENRSFQRVFEKFIPKQNADRISPTLARGDATLPLSTVVQEAGVSYGLDYSAGYSAGLFIDQRANRRYVRESGIKRLLNTFAYTCSFSVAGALTGAECVSVDLSRKSLDRGRDNFALNGLDAGAHQFIADDVLDVLPRLQRRGLRFDCIILDPPTFSRGNSGRRFQVEKDLEHLLTLALELAEPKARVLLSTNCSKLNRRALEQIARFALKLSRRSADFHAEPPLPDFPPNTGAHTLWMLLKS